MPGTPMGLYDWALSQPGPHLVLLLPEERIPRGLRFRLYLMAKRGLDLVGGATTMLLSTPLTLLVLVLLFEVARFAWRGALPAHAPARAPRPTDWARSPEGDRAA